MSHFQIFQTTSSLYRIAQICTAFLSMLYLLRGGLSIETLGVSFPVFLSSGVGLLLIPVAILLGQPRRSLPNFMVGISIIGLVANPTMMILYRAQETTPIFLISSIVILLWATLFGIFCLPTSRQVVKPN
jgi:hypothetical protein